MNEDRPRRVMWLLNHKAAREFEIPMLKRVGFQEIYLPKSLPEGHNFRSANVDYSEDRNLTIPPHDLEKLNQTNWYAPVPRDVWAVANRHFDVIFFILHDLRAVESMAVSFHGAMLLRAYGLDRTLSYGNVLGQYIGANNALSKARHRFWLAHAYEGIEAYEETWLRERALYLPLGLGRPELTDTWRGRDDRLMFICPEIGFNPYYRDVYEEFVRTFQGIPYVIAGTQPIPIEDPSVTGFLSREEFDNCLRESKVLFYHSSEPRHVHYHPFEAVRSGMPLVFMAGGVLERLAGQALPGQASTLGEARSKVERILRGDESLIKSIRNSQTVLLDAMAPARLEPFWQNGFRNVLANLDEQRSLAVEYSGRRKKVAVIVPLGYRGGSMRAAKLVAEALLVGSQQCGEEVQIIFAHLEDPETYSMEEFADLAPGIEKRPFRWQEIKANHARDAMKLALHEGWEPRFDKYRVPDDGINHLLDCDAWVIISDRLDHPLLPMRPRIHVIYDYIQRYVDIMDASQNQAFLNAALDADLILVTTDFSRKDAVQYAGARPDRVKKLPMLSPRLFKASFDTPPDSPNYFVWATNAAPHKNHERALQALSIYYGDLDGTLECHVCGVNTDHLFLKDEHKNRGRPDRARMTKEAPEKPASSTYYRKYKYLDRIKKIYRSDKNIQNRLKVLGEMSNSAYKKLLERSAFLFHPGLIDNGTFSVIEAAQLGVPALSSNYPAMQEIDEQFSLNLTMFDPTDVGQMADKLKWMEDNFSQVRRALPGGDVLDAQDPAKFARAYWAEVREWL